MGSGTSFGQLIKSSRMAFGLTQAELARRVGCATITIRKIEADALRPSIQIGERLAMALDVPLEDRADFIRLSRLSDPNTPEPPPTPTPAPSDPAPGAGSAATTWPRRSAKAASAPSTAPPIPPSPSKWPSRSSCPSSPTTPT